MAGHLDARGAHRSRVHRRVGDDLARAVGQVGAIPVEEDEVGARRRRRRGHGRGRGRRTRHRARLVEGVAQADEHGVVPVRRLERRAGRGPRHRVAPQAEAVVIERREIAILERRREARHRQDVRRNAADRLVGEVALRAARAERRARAVADEACVAQLGPGVAGTTADVGGQEREARDVEVVENVAHHPVGALEPAGAAEAGLRAEALDALDLVLAEIALDLDPQAVAEAVADAAERDPAGLEVDAAVAARHRRDAGERIRRELRLLEEVRAACAGDVEAGHRRGGTPRKVPAKEAAGLGLGMRHRRRGREGHRGGEHEGAVDLHHVAPRQGRTARHRASSRHRNGRVVRWFGVLAQPPRGVAEPPHQSQSITAARSRRGGSAARARRPRWARAGGSRRRPGCRSRCG